MFKQRRFQCISILLLLVLSFTCATPTFACLPSPEPPPPLEAHIDYASIIFVGTVVEFVGTSEYLSPAQVEVETYLQGTGPAAAEVSTLIKHIHDPCGSYSPSLLGQRLIFLVYNEREILLAEAYTHIQDLSRVETYISDPLRPLYRLGRQAKHWVPGMERVNIVSIGWLGIALVFFTIGFVMVKQRMVSGIKPKAKRGNAEV